MIVVAKFFAALWGAFGDFLATAAASINAIPQETAGFAVTFGMRALYIAFSIEPTMVRTQAKPVQIFVDAVREFRP